MKKTMCRVLSAVMSLVLCVTALAVCPFTALADDTAMPVMAYVPLDNRPVCVDRIRYQAASAGFDVRMPDKDLYTTRLDNQGYNANGTQIGDGAAIAEWLLEMDKNGCDYFIIHLDQMFSGGLVGSRYPDNTSVTKAETDIIDNCLIPLSNDGNNHIYFVDTVMRLASTGGFKGYEQPEYGSFRDYAMQDRKVLDSTAFYTTDYNTSAGHVNTIAQNYQKGPNGETLTFYTGERTDWKGPLTQAQVDDYHKARTRKLTLLNLMMQFANRKAVYIIGVDDAHASPTIQYNEIQFIHQRMKALGYTYFLSADTDSSGMMAVARCVTDYYGAKEIPAKVRYYGDQIDVAADDYDIGTLRENVATHLEAANCKVTSGEGELEVLVLTKNDASYTLSDAYKAVKEGTLQQSSLDTMKTRYANNINALIAQAQANIAANKPTIILEASTEGNYQYAWVKKLTNLQDEILTKLDVSRLLGYSNWNTVGNTIGIAVGQGVARYAYLKYEDNIAPSTHVAFAKALTYSYMKDITYNARNKHQHFTDTFQYWITNKAGGSGWNNGNFYQQMINYTDDSTYKEDWESCRGEHYVNNELEYCMMRGGSTSAYTGCGQQVLNAIMAGKMYTDLHNTVRTGTPGSITVDRFYCPWYRQFEITFSIFVDRNAPYVKDSSFVTRIPLQETYETFEFLAGTKYNATWFTVQDLNGTALTDDNTIGTDYTITMTVDGVTTSYKAVVVGDVDGDADRDTSDVRDCMLAVIDFHTLSAAQSKAADYNASGAVDSTDARRMLQDAITAA